MKPDRGSREPRTIKKGGGKSLGKSGEPSDGESGCEKVGKNHRREWGQWWGQW